MCTDSGPQVAGAQCTGDLSSGARNTPDSLRAPTQHPGVHAVSAMGTDQNSTRHPLAPERLDTP